MKVEDDQKEGEKQRENYEHPAQLINVPPDPPDNSGRDAMQDNRPENPNKSAWRKWVKKAIGPMGLYTLGLLVVAGLQWCVTLKQLKEMKADGEQTDALIKKYGEQVEALKDANELSEEAIRGRIAITNHRLRGPVTIGVKTAMLIETENVGHAVAYDRSVKKTARWAKQPDGAIPVVVPDKSANTPSEPGANGLLVAEDPAPITQELLDGIATGKAAETIFFFGSIVYETLGREHRTNFCAYLMPSTSPSGLESPATRGAFTDNRLMLMKCERWNDAY